MKTNFWRVALGVVAVAVGWGGWSVYRAGLNPAAVATSALGAQLTTRNASTRAETDNVSRANATALQIAGDVSEAKASPTGTFSPQMRELVAGLRSGRPLDVSLGGLAPRRFGFRPLRVTAPGFQVSTGAGDATRLSAEWEVFSGREFLGEAGLGEVATLAVVNDAVALALTLDGENFLIEPEAGGGELVARRVPALGGHDGADCPCAVHGGVASVTVSEPAPSDAETERWAVAIALVQEPEEPLDQIEDVWVENGDYRRGPLYDASLRDILVLWASSKHQTGPSSGLSGRAAAYLTIAGRVADTYERQLGLRYLLQELILIPSDAASEADVGNPPTGKSDLSHWRLWLETNRPQATYGWGHAACWTLVDGSPGGTIGKAWTNSFGNALTGQSVQERVYGWDVHNHELGHNLGASHTSGGLMNSTLRTNDENFFTRIQNGTVTAATSIHTHLTGNAIARAHQYGAAPLRDPQQIPFAVDDLVSTPAGEAVPIVPLANDAPSVFLGATNVLRLVEIGAVYPREAGSAVIAADETVVFTPAPGFVGQVWFTYTISGDVGNAGAGWLHSADVSVTVGDVSTPPTLSPALSLADDVLTADFSNPIRLNPLLNDEGRGRLWAGDVEVVLTPTGSVPQAYGDGAFQLVSATLLAGRGTLTVETRRMTRSGVTVLSPAGYLVYAPSPNDLDRIVIAYVARDADGREAQATVTLNRAPIVTLAVDQLRLAKYGGRVAVFTVTRSANAPLVAAERIHFSVDYDGSGPATGLAPRFALAGPVEFGPEALAGSVLIPAGAASASWFLVLADDGVPEGDSRLVVRIVGADTLLVSEPSVAEVRLSDFDPVERESFDALSIIGLGNGWMNVASGVALGEGLGTDSRNWLVGSGPTPLGATFATGPAGGYPDATGNYLYVTASGAPSGSTAALLSPTYDLSGAAVATLEFAYHLYGANIGALRLDVFAKGVWHNNVVVFSGQQSEGPTDWKKCSLDLAPYLTADLRLRFRGVVPTGSSLGLSGDMALDEVRITSMEKQPARPPQFAASPSERELEIGDPLYLAAAATGYPAPRYQWLKNARPVPGATGPAYHVPSVGVIDAGVYVLRAKVGDTEVFSEPVVVMIGGRAGPEAGFAFWLATEDSGLTGADAGARADPDGDGLDNLLEYALGGNPGNEDNIAALLAKSRLVEDDAGLWLECEYRRRTGGIAAANGDYVAGDLTYRVQRATGLVEGAWSRDAEALDTSAPPVPDGPGFERATVRTFAGKDAESAVFLRLLVTIPDLAPPAPYAERVIEGGRGRGRDEPFGGGDNW